MTALWRVVAICLVVAASSGGSLIGADLKIVGESIGGGVRSRTYVGRISKTDFSKMVWQLLGPESVKLGKIVVYGSDSARAIAGPLGVDHCGYGSWRACIDAYDRGRLGCPEVYEAAKIGANIVVRTADRSCHREEHLLQGRTSPLRMVVAGTKVEVLDMEVGYGKFGASGGFAVRSQGAASEEIARAVLTEIRARTGMRDFGVMLRADKWFFTSCGFPVFYPFEELELPSNEDYLRSKFAYCGSSGSWPVRCFSSASR